MPNHTDRDRAMAHTFLSTGFAFDQSEAPGSLCAAYEALPESPSERRRHREEMAALQREAWLRYRASSAR